MAMRAHITPLRGLVLLVLFAAMLLLVLAPGADAEGILVTESYTVVAGDSLWAVAEARTPHEADVRETVFEIKRLNGLATGVIHPGQVLRLPVS